MRHRIHNIPEKARQCHTVSARMHCKMERSTQPRIQHEAQQGQEHVLPFCLLVNRYGIYSPDFIRDLSPSASLLVTAGVFIAYIIIREGAQFFFGSKKISKETSNASHMAFYTFFCTATLVTLATSGILHFTNLSDNRKYHNLRTRSILHNINRAQVSNFQ